MNTIRFLLARVSFEAYVLFQFLHDFGWKRMWKLKRTRQGRGVHLCLPQSDRRVCLRPGSSDWKVYVQVFGGREYEPAFPLENVRRIADFGSNTGLTALYLAEHFPDAVIHAVELEKSNTALAREHLKNHPRITLHEGAVWSRSGKFGVCTAEREAWAFELGLEEEGGVQARTVGEWWALWDWDRVDVVKMDVEGAEREIFSDVAAAKAWMNQTRLLLIETHDGTHPGSMKALVDVLHDMDFRWVSRGQTHQIFLGTVDG